MEPIKTDAFELALKFIHETNVNIFLTGKAGTGKTTFLKYLREHPVKNMAVAAPTGVAAINAGGITLHAMFQLPFACFIPANHETTIGIDRKTLLSRMRFNSEKLNFFNSLELLVIDEASMVASYTVDAIDLILRTVRHKQIPFGGVQVLFIGDLYQLQPVVKEDEWQLLKNYYSSGFFFDSLVLKANIPVMIELKKIFRQKDEHFIDILNGLRENQLTREHLKILNGRLKPDFITQNGDGYITLTTHNASANRINENKLKELKGAPFRFTATIEYEFPDHLIPAEKELVLKEGAQVMFIKNDPEKKFFNGKIGVIEELSDDEIIVSCNGERIHVNEYIWENLKYTVDPESKTIKETVIGTFTQYPLRLAWAITIHKSQGLTFDKVVIDAENAFANGQVYVALSRATTLEGLVLTSPVNDRFLGPHADLKSWQETRHASDSLPALFEKAREEYSKQLLFGVFSYDQFLFYLSKLKKEMPEFISEENVRKWNSEFTAKHEDLLDVSRKFKHQLETLWKSDDPAVKEKLDERVIEATKYFSLQIKEWQEILNAHTLRNSNRRISRYIDKILNEINDEIIFLQTKMKLCENGIRINELITWKKNLPEKGSAVRTTFIQQEKAGIDETRSGLYDMLDEYRKEIALEKDLPDFLIFSNHVIRSCCANLPGDSMSLMKLCGLGKTKMMEYGNDILKLIREFCEENEIELQFAKSSKKSNHGAKNNEPVTATVMKTISLIRSGKNIKDICLQRNLAESTIERHLALAIENRLLQIETLMDADDVEILRNHFRESDNDLKLVRERCGEKFSYGQIKLVRAWIIANSSSHVLT